MSDLEYKDYEEIYKKWKAGELHEGEVRRVGGEGLLDLMQAQRILDMETQEEDVTLAATPKEAETMTSEGGTTE